MTSIGNTGYTNLASQVLVLNKGKSPKEYTPESFEVPVIDITPEFEARYSNAKERAKLKCENSVRWTSNSLYKTDLKSPIGYTVNKDALNKVRERLEKEGVDPSRRTPTHEITDEQMDQLAEKYDFEYLSQAGMEDPEYGNFLLDLAYMNVFSLDEMDELFGVSEFNANHLCYTYVIHSGAGSYYVGANGQHFSSWDDVVKSINDEYIRIKYPGRTENFYQKKTEEYMAQAEERIRVIHDFFDRASKYYENGFTNTVKPKIEDVSGKLKEDFGGRM